MTPYIETQRLDKLLIQALELAREGHTTPNPMVGAIIVALDGTVLGQGWHRKAGQPHAEMEALHAAAIAGHDVRGSTMVVTLEPCNHYGRTPPCTEAIIKSGIAHVHIAHRDPNPVASGGYARLTSAGIRVTLASQEVQAAAARQNEVFFHWARTGQPFVYGKWAMSLDGKIATHTGHAQWISSRSSREHAHRLRAQVAAILVGAGTIRADNPSLTTRLPNGDGHHPVRVILDTYGSLPLSARVLTGELPGQTIIATTNAAPTTWLNALPTPNVEPLILPRDSNDRVAIPSLLDALAKRKLTSLLVEGGATVHGTFLDGGHIQRAMIYIAPVLIGGRGAPSPIGGKGVTTMDKAIRLKNVSTTFINPDTFMTGLIHP